MRTASSISATKLGNRIRFVDAVPHDDVPKLFAGADVLVSPSRDVPGWTEQFGHILAWAMAAGVPIVGSRCGAIPEVVGDAGILVPQNDAAAIADALSRLGDKALCAKPGAPAPRTTTPTTPSPTAWNWR